jgi:hypothetical protein
MNRGSPLDMHSNDISSSLHKIINPILWLDHHQMAVKDIFIAQSSQSFDHWRADRHLLHEPAVLNIDMDPVITSSVDLFKLFPKLREISLRY